MILTAKGYAHIITYDSFVYTRGKNNPMKGVRMNLIHPQALQLLTTVSNPVTGDNSMVSLVVGLMAAAAVVLVVVLLLTRNKK